MRDRQSAVTSLHRAVGVTRQPEMESHERRNPSQPVLIANPLGERLSLAEEVEDSRELSERSERVSKIQPEINPLLDRFTSLRNMREGSERLLEA
jgi:hypothetical protein